MIFCTSCDKKLTGKWPPIKFQPTKVIIKTTPDTIEVKANKWIDITDAHVYPGNGNNTGIYLNITQDTLIADWMKAVALNNKETGERIMKIISLKENDTGIERSYVIMVGNGPSFGHLIVTQTAK